jgi:hypothetical protein
LILLKRFIGKNRLKNPAAPLARKTGDAFAFSGLELDPIAKYFQNDSLPLWKGENNVNRSTKAVSS